MKVSACIITYNQEKYIAQCLDGALSQIVDFDYEIVIGEDKSTDGTLAICKKYAEKYPTKIRLIERETNLGMAGNWMNTISSCTGKYIAICEGDDYWTDHLKLQKQTDYLESNKNVVACGGNVDVEFFGELQNSEIKINEIVISGNEDLYYRHPFATLTIMFENKNMKDLLNYESIIVDVELFHFLSKVGDFALFPDKFGVYRYHGKGANSGNTHYFNKRKQIEALTKISEAFKIPNHKSNLTKKLVRESFYNLKNLRHGDVLNNLNYTYYCFRMLCNKLFQN